MKRTFTGTWREDHETIDDDNGDWTELSDWFQDLDGKKVTLTIETGARSQGWANDPEIAPLKYELQRLRTELEAKSRELSNARIERDAAWAQLRGKS